MKIVRNYVFSFLVAACYATAAFSQPWPAGGPGPALPTPAAIGAAPAIPAQSVGLTVTQPAANQVFQRLSTTGGLYNLGAGFIPLQISLTAPASKIEVQLRDAVASGNPVLVPYAQITGPFNAGAQTLQVPAPARLGWYFVDVRANGDPTQVVLGTAPVGMGHVVGLLGQSLANNFVQPSFNDYSTTLASLGLTVNANASVDVGSWSYTGTAPWAQNFSNNNSSFFFPFWAIPADNQTTYHAYYGAGVVQFENMLVAKLGVNVAVVGQAVGATPLSLWQPGQPFNAAFKNAIRNAGGVIGTLIWWQGQGDSNLATAAANYEYGLIATIQDIVQTFPTLSPGLIIASIGDMIATSQGTAAAINTVRSGSQATATFLGAQYVAMLDAAMYSDGIHHSQAGEVTDANHLYRAVVKSLGYSTNGDVGPSIASVSRSGTTLTLTLSQQSGGTALNGVGTWYSKFSSFNHGTTTSGCTITAGAVVDATHVTLTCSAAPSGAQDIYYAYPYTTSGNATAGLYDNVTDGDGITLGRELQLNTAAVASN